MRVFGIYDRSTGNFRLRAAEPRSGDEWFKQVVASLPVWVRKGSTVVSDYFVDNDRLRSLGYEVKVQNNTSGRHNVNIMDYLRKIVPKMFQVIISNLLYLSNHLHKPNLLQNSLSLLKLSAIQQHLDELTFRELCGHHPLLAFESLLQRISNQTAAAMERGTTFGARMKSVASRPSDDWRITLLSQVNDQRKAARSTNSALPQAAELMLSEG